jgi:hypothetical protein
MAYLCIPVTFQLIVIICPFQHLKLVWHIKLVDEPASP